MTNRKKILAGLGFGLLITIYSCGSTSSHIDYSTEIISFTENSSDCGLTRMGPVEDVIPAKQMFNSKIPSESMKYDWVDYSDTSDYYQYRLEDPSYLTDDLNQSKGFQRCSEFLKNEIINFKSDTSDKYSALTPLVASLLKNVESASAVTLSQSNLPNVKASRNKYMELEDLRRRLQTEREATFGQIRSIIDVTYFGDVQVYIPRCPTYFTAVTTTEDWPGTVILKNMGNSSQKVTFNLIIKNKDGIIIDTIPIDEEVPANSTLQKSITAFGASEGIGGIIFPPTCSIATE